MKKYFFIYFLPVTDCWMLFISNSSEKWHSNKHTYGIEIRFWRKHAPNKQQFENHWNISVDLRNKFFTALFTYRWFSLLTVYLIFHYSFFNVLNESTFYVIFISPKFFSFFFWFMLLFMKIWKIAGMFIFLENFPWYSVWELLEKLLLEFSFDLYLMSISIGLLIEMIDDDFGKLNVQGFENFHHYGTFFDFFGIFIEIISIFLMFY